MSYSVFIDDERTPKTQAPVGDWIICRNLDSFKYTLFIQGEFPSHISFDHDLGDNEQSGKEIANYIANTLLDKIYTIPEDFTFNVHSANPVGSENITGTLTQIVEIMRSYGRVAPKKK